MKQRAWLYLFIPAQFLLAALALMALYVLHAPAGYLLAFAAAESALLFYLYRTAFRPLYRLERLLLTCRRQEGGAIELLRRNAGYAVYADEISQIVSACLAQATRDNYAILHDKQAELAALQSQINPHFLYNTLDSIRGQALIDKNTEIAMMVKALADFFRYSISRKGELVTLRDELANAKNYMMIQQYRFDNRFRLEILIQEEDEVAYDFLIPKLIIQPIIENAIYHGLKDTLEGGVITIEVSRTYRSLILLISDNGSGMDYPSLMDLNMRIKSPERFDNNPREESPFHTGIALTNIHKRIQLLFGDRYGIQIFSTPNQGTDVEIMLPANGQRTDTV